MHWRRLRRAADAISVVLASAELLLCCFCQRCHRAANAGTALLMPPPCSCRRHRLSIGSRFFTHRDLRAHPTSSTRTAQHPTAQIQRLLQSATRRIAIFAFVSSVHCVVNRSNLFVRCRVGVMEALSTNLPIPTHKSRKWGGGRKMRKVSFFLIRSTRSECIRFSVRTTSRVTVGTELPNYFLTTS